MQQAVQPHQLQRAATIRDLLGQALWLTNSDDVCVKLQQPITQPPSPSPPLINRSWPCTWLCKVLMSVMLFAPWRAVYSCPNKTSSGCGFSCAAYLIGQNNNTKTHRNTRSLSLSLSLCVCVCVCVCVCQC
jgi:hypothetical protein